MNPKRRFIISCLLAALFLSGSNASAAENAKAGQDSVAATPKRTCPANGKLKIFILSGQSNMVGFGQLEGETGTMEAYVRSNPTDYAHLVDQSGKHVVRDDVWIVNLSYKDKETMGWLTTGYGASDGHIGPEYAFGFAVGDYYEDPVLIIKSAWGGRSLYHNFLSPRSAKYPTPEKDGDMGFQYAEILRHVKEITCNLRKYYPSYAGKGYEIVGFGWHQGWNDRINQQAVDVYEKNMENFVKDIRKDLDIENLPFVIANTGMGGWDIPPTARYKKRVEKLMAAQLHLADPKKYPAFQGNVSGVETRDFQRTREESPSRQDYHWFRNWETLYLIGKSMGDSMVNLVANRPATPDAN
ncbi:MAG: sialate O-acetylesterase [Pirellulales bacterium]|nr:sialate O-acetylesterase [Pirellulales bacterium]